MVQLREMEWDKNTVFQTIKPVCDRFMRDPSKVHCEELVSTLHSIPSPYLQEMQTYVLFPMEVHLKRMDLSKEMKRPILDTLKELLLCTEIQDVDVFFHLYSFLFSLIFDSCQTDMVADVPEEFKLSAIECATELLCQCPVSVVKEIYKTEHAPKLSQGMYICVQLMQKEKLRSLRIAAISFLMTVAHVHDETRVTSSALRHQVANMLLFVLPGILSGLQKVVVGDEKQGHLVTYMAVRAFCRMLVLMIEDDALPKQPPFTKFHLVAKVSEQSAVSSTPYAEESKEDFLRTLKTQTRSPQWLADIVKKAGILLESFSTLQKHSHWKVRLELATSYHLLLEKCLRNLSPVAVTLIDVLLKLSDDPMEQVSSQSKEAIEMLSRKLTEESETSLLEILEENLFNLITKLPRVVRGTDDAEKSSELSLLAVYLRLLGPDKLPHVLNSASHLQRLVLTLTQVVELDTAHVSLLEDSSLRDLDQSSTMGQNRPWKQFKHFMDHDVLLKVEAVCHLLGQFGDLDILSDYLLDLLSIDSHHRSEAVLVLNEILAGASGEHCDRIVKNVLDVYLESSLWNVPLSVQEDHIPMGQAQSNLVLACLLVEGVGKMAVTLSSNLNQFLLRTLYLVMERAGSTHYLLALAGTTAAKELALAGGHGRNLTSLLTSNMDYLSFHVTMKLRKVDQNPGVLDVLSIAMRHSNKDLLPFLQNIVDNVLLQSCDTFQDHHALSFLQVFNTYFMSVRKWLTEEENGAEQEPQKRGVNNLQEVMDTLVQYHENKQLSECKGDEQSLDDLLPEDEAAKTEEVMDESKPKVPNYVEMTDAILKRCLHFLPSKDKELKLLALQTLQEGLHILANWEDQLLPVVHLIWSPLIGRFEDAADPLILNRSFSLLHTLALLAKDFIRSRTLQKVLPHICQYLSRSASESKQKDSGSVYRFTQAYKLQYELLDKLGDLAVSLNFQEKELYQVLRAASPYLSSLQPPPLQKCCMKLFQTVATADEDAVWLEVTRLATQVSGDGNTVFKSNTELLLESFG